MRCSVPGPDGRSYGPVPVSVSVPGEWWMPAGWALVRWAASRPRSRGRRSARRPGWPAPGVVRPARRWRYPVRTPSRGRPARRGTRRRRDGPAGRGCGDGPVRLGCCGGPVGLGCCDGPVRLGCCGGPVGLGRCDRPAVRGCRCAPETVRLRACPRPPHRACCSRPGRPTRCPRPPCSGPPRSPAAGPAPPVRIPVRRRQRILRRTAAARPAPEEARSRSWPSPGRRDRPSSARCPAARSAG